MTKFKLLSDLHLECCEFTYTDDGEDVVILAGDIHTRNRHHKLIAQIPTNKQVLLVAGNHSYYHGEFHGVNQYLSELMSRFPNVVWLNNNSISNGDVSIYGGTMFTSMGLYGEYRRPLVEIETAHSINDFRYINIQEGDTLRRWSIEDHKGQHKLFVEGIEKWLDNHTYNKRLVISHFMPHEKAISQQYAGSSINPYFTEDMTKYQGWKGVWVYGHGHSSGDFMEGDTRLLANPKGYRNENPHFTPHLIFEL